MEYQKSSKTAQLLENQILKTSSTLIPIVELDELKDEKKKVQELLVTKPESSAFSYFYSMIPKEILGIPVAEIRKDISEMSQLSSM